MVLAFASRSWVLIAAGVGALVWLQGLLSLQLRIRREENDGSETGSPD
jgi:hypothetical protein